MYVMVDGLARLLAPILPMTADELWRALPGAREASVHLALCRPTLDAWRDDALVERWTRLIAVRDVVNGALEAQRQAKTIGTSLEAKVVLARARRDAGAAPRERGPARMLFIVSATEVRDAGGDGPELAVEVAAQRRHQVRALLALRPRHLDRAGVRRPVRPLRRGGRGAGMTASTATVEALRRLRRARRRASRPRGRVPSCGWRWR